MRDVVMRAAEFEAHRARFDDRDKTLVREGHPICVTAAKLDGFARDLGALAWSYGAPDGIVLHFPS